MSDSEPEYDVNEGIVQIHEQVVKNVFAFLKTGSFSNKTKESYMVAYTLVYKLSDDERNSSIKLFDYFNSMISDYLNEINSNLSSISDEVIVEVFLQETERANILIHWMRKVFGYLDKFYTKNYKKGSLFYNALKVFNSVLFSPMKERLIKAVNRLIDAHRSNKSVEISQINGILRIFEQVDMKNPVLVKDENGFNWTGIPTKEVYKEWFAYFLRSTESYVSSKSKKEITSSTVSEYVKSALEYLKDEEVRKSLFINKEFHDQLDLINTKILIESHSKTLTKVIKRYKLLYRWTLEYYLCFSKRRKMTCMNYTNCFLEVMIHSR